MKSIDPTDLQHLGPALRFKETKNMGSIIQERKISAGFLMINANSATQDIHGRTPEPPRKIDS